MLITFLHLVYAIALLLILRRYTKGDIGNAFRHPIVLCLVASILVHGLMPALQAATGVYRYTSGFTGYSLSSHIWALCLCVLFTIVSVFTYENTTWNVRQRAAPAPKRFRGRAFVIVFILFPAVYGAMTFAFIVQMVIGYENFTKDRIYFSDRYGGVWLLFSDWLSVAFLLSLSFLLLDVRLRKPWAIMAIAVAVSSISALVFATLTQSRNTILIMTLLGAGAYALLAGGRKISLVKMTVASRFSILLLLSIGAIAYTSHLRNVKDNVKGSLLGKTYISVNGAFGNHENLLWLLENRFPVQLGHTYYAGFVVPFPRAWWPEKPVGAGPVLKNLLRPGSYNVGERGASSVTTGTLTEAYMNGESIGVTILAALTGMLLKLVASMRHLCRTPWTLAIYLFTCVIFGFSLIYQEFLGAYARWFVAMLPLGIGMVLFDLNLSGKRRLP